MLIGLLRSREGGRLPWASRCLGATSLLRNMKYTRICYFKKKDSKIFSPEGPHENVSPGPAVALDVPEC